MLSFDLIEKRLDFGIFHHRHRAAFSADKVVVRLAAGKFIDHAAVTAIAGSDHALITKEIQRAVNSSPVQVRGFLAHPEVDLFQSSMTTMFLNGLQNEQALRSGAMSGGTHDLNGIFEKFCHCCNFSQ